MSLTGVHVHLMRPKKEDWNSLLVSVVRLADLSEHTGLLHVITAQNNASAYSQHEYLQYKCVFECVRTLAGQ